MKENCEKIGTICKVKEEEEEEEQEEEKEKNREGSLKVIQCISLGT